MRRGTTPTLTISLGEDVKVSDYASVWVTFAQNKEVLFTKTKDDILVLADGTFQLKLTQEETLALGTGTVDIQARLANNNGAVAVASNIVTVAVTAILKDGEIT